MLHARTMLVERSCKEESGAMGFKTFYISILLLSNPSSHKQKTKTLLIKLKSPILLPHIPPKLPPPILRPLLIPNPHLLPPEPLQHAPWPMPHDLDADLPRPRRALSDLAWKQGRHVGEAGAEFALEGEIGFFGEGGGLEVVGAGEGVEVGDGEGVVGVFDGLPGGVAEGGERGEGRGW